MKINYTRYETSDLLEDLGEDVVHLKIYFRMDELPEVNSGILLPFSELVKFIRQTNPSAYDYLTKMRSSITGYGPKETKVLAKIEEEDFDLESFIKNYLESKDEVYISQHLEWIEKLNSTKTLGQAAKILESLTSDGDVNYVSDQIKWNKYRDELDQTIHELTFRYFPELFENGAEKIDAYRNALTLITIDFTNRLDKIVNID
jgi:hypothetical protein